jgi:hypothetical protein
MSSIFEPPPACPGAGEAEKQPGGAAKAGAGGPRRSPAPAADPDRLNRLDLFEARDFLHEELFHPLFQGHL